MSAEATTEDLLTRIAGRDPRALADFYDRVAPILRGIALRILSSAEAAEEVLEETFLELWKRQERQEPSKEGEVARMVLHIRNSSVQRLRRIRDLPPLAGLEHGTSLSDKCLASPAEVAFVSKRQELLRRLLNQLPVAQRKVLDLCLLEGYSEAEIAQALTQPLGKVRDELRASLGFARQRLQTLMGTWIADI
ncbi:MAG TPA: sigma-70 family RNA polymerase sigma factor [Terriglobia bacterium]|nr:sigma-70 family RNA polymerase sigma factor [Terriglobia bacterium]